MADALQAKRKSLTRYYGISRKGFYKSEQKQRAKRALEQELQRALRAPAGPEPEDIAPDPEPENTVYDANWISIAWDEDDAA